MTWSLQEEQLIVTSDDVTQCLARRDCLEEVPGGFNEGDIEQHVVQRVTVRNTWSHPEAWLSE